MKFAEAEQYFKTFKNMKISENVFFSVFPNSVNFHLKLLLLAVSCSFIHFCLVQPELPDLGEGHSGISSCSSSAISETQSFVWRLQFIKEEFDGLSAIRLAR